MLLNFHNGRVQITFTKDELIHKINQQCYICWSIEESIKEMCGRAGSVSSTEVINTIRRLAPNRFMRKFDDFGVDLGAIEDSLLRKYISKSGDSARDIMINTRINLIKSLPSDTITFDLSYTPRFTQRN